MRVRGPAKTAILVIGRIVPIAYTLDVVGVKGHQSVGNKWIKVFPFLFTVLVAIFFWLILPKHWRLR